MHFSKSVPLLCVLALACIAGTFAQSWDEPQAKIALRLSWAAYCPPQQISSWSCYWCKYSGTPSLSIVGTTIDSSTATLGYVGYTSDTIFVSFRGTTNLKNLLLDASIAKDVMWPDQPKVKVHAGFRKGWLNLARGISQSISEAQSRCPRCSRIFFTGHSLGGALATLAAIDYSRSDSGLPVQSITLGCPRIGNSDFSAYAIKMVPNTIRWTHTTDPVVHLPPKLFSWRHKTREVWQNGEHSYKICSATNPEDSSCADSVLPIGLNGIDEHSNYGATPLHSGTCDTFAKRADFTEEELYAIIAAANADLKFVQDEQEAQNDGQN